MSFRPPPLPLRVPSSSRRRGIVILVVGVLAVVLAYALVPQAGALRAIIPLLSHVRPAFFGLAMLCQMGVYGCVALILRSGLGAVTTPQTESEGMPGAKTLLSAAAAFLWANRALPGPAVAGLATLIFVLGRDREKPVSAAAAQAAAAVFYVADYVGFIALGLLTVLGCLLLSRYPGQNSPTTALPILPAALAAGLIFLGIVGVFFVLRSPIGVRRVAERLAFWAMTLLRRPEPTRTTKAAGQAIDQFFLRWQAVTAQPGALTAACGVALVMHLLEATTFVGAVWAFGGPPNTAAGLRAVVGASAGYVAGNLAAIVSFLPAGLGFFEGAMGTTLHLVGGIAIPTAATATLVYRFFSVWLPLPAVLGTARQAITAASRGRNSTEAETLL